MNDRRRSAGFTLIELIIVLVLMTIIGASVVIGSGLFLLRREAQSAV